MQSPEGYCTALTGNSLSSSAQPSDNGELSWKAYGTLREFLTSAFPALNLWKSAAVHLVKICHALESILSFLKLQAQPSDDNGLNLEKAPHTSGIISLSSPSLLWDFNVNSVKVCRKGLAGQGRLTLWLEYFRILIHHVIPLIAIKSLLKIWLDFP